MATLVVHGLTLIGLAIALFNLLLLLILRIDWQHHLIFVATIAPGIMLALAFAVLRSPAALLSATIAGAGAGLLFSLFFVLAMLIYRQQALGFGDILLAVLIGTMTGIRSLIPALFLGMLLAALGGLLLIAVGIRSRRDYIPYGAYLCAGTILVLIVYR
jgi:leader peptidase (prepilin peptidase)/N-methyltransferase